MTDAERDAERERQEAERRAMREIRDRDADLPLRVFVLAERLPASEVTAFRMVSALANRTSDLRVTVGVAEASEDDVRALEAKDVEVLVDPAGSWIAERPMHATAVVVLGPAAAVRFGAIVRDREPQAAIVYDPSGPVPDDHVAARAAEAPIVAAAHVVLAPVRGYAEFVGTLAPDSHVVHSAPGTPDLDRRLAQALALCGVAVPDAALA